MRDPFANYPGLVRHDHPDTAHEAAQRVLPRTGTQRRAVYDYIATRAEEGATDRELQRHLALPGNSERPRRIELAQMGLLCDSGQRREDHIVWVLAACPTPNRPRRSPVIYVDRMKLRQYLNEAPLKVKEAVAAKLAGRPSLSDDSYDDNPQALYEAALDAINAANSVGFTLAFPVDTEPYRAQLFELPADLMDVAQTGARVYSVPNLAHAGQWTPDHADTVSGILAQLTEEADTRRKRVHALLGEVALNEDHVRHAIIKQLTGDRAESSTALTAPEVDALDGWVQAVKVDRVEFHLPSMKLADAKTGEVLPPYQCDWRSFAKSKGITTSQLTKLARNAAELLGMPAPSKVGDVTDSRLTAALWRLVDAEAALGRLGGTEEEPQAPQAPEPAPGPQVGAKAAIAAPGAPVGAVVPPGDRASLVVMLPVPLGQLRQVLDVLGL